MKDLHTKNLNTLMKKLRKIQINGKISHSFRKNYYNIKISILLKVYSEMPFIPKFQWYFL